MCICHDCYFHFSIRVFNAFNDSGEFKVMLTAGSGEITPCGRDEFETGELGFMGVSNRSTVTVGRFVQYTFPLPPTCTYILNYRYLLIQGFI